MTTKEARYVSGKDFSVTQADIDKGEQRCATSCAAAAAIGRQLGAHFVRIHKGKVAFTVNGWRYKFDAPIKLQELVTRYDQKDGKKTCKPATFMLRDGFAMRAKRTGSSNDAGAAMSGKTHGRRARKARKGYTGPRVSVTKDRSAGAPVIKVIHA